MPSGNTLLVLSVLQAGLLPNLIAVPSSVLTTILSQATQKGTKASGRTLKLETYTDTKGESRGDEVEDGQVIAPPDRVTRKRIVRTSSNESRKMRRVKVETYDDAKGETRWRLKATNGQGTATSGQGYKDKRDSENAIRRHQGEPSRRRSRRQVTRRGPECGKALSGSE